MQRSGYLLPTGNEPRVRRARDAAKIGLGTLVVLATANSAVQVGSLQDAIAKAAAELPGWAEIGLWVGYGLGGVYAAAIIVAISLRAGRNPGAARDVIVAVAVTIVLAILLTSWREGGWPELLPEIGGADPRRQFPIVRAALVTAVVLAAAPHIARAARRLGHAMILLVAFAGFGLGFGYPSDALAAVGVGLVAAGGVLLTFGSPNGYPPTRVVADALRGLGLSVTDLRLTSDQSWGTRRFMGTTLDGVGVEIKAFGRDAMDSQLAAKLWRALWYRGTRPTDFSTRMQVVEHEALLLMFAQRAGVLTVEPMAAGMAGDDVAILVVRHAGRSLRDLGPWDVDDDALVEIWSDVARLHAAGISHGSLNTSAILITPYGHAFEDFEEGSLGSGEQTHRDVAELLFSLASQFGAERAIATARAGLGDEMLTAALPVMQLPAISPAARRLASKPKSTMKDLRQSVAEALEVDLPEPAELRRVSVGKLVMLALILFAANALISQLAGIDYAAVWRVIQDAEWVGLLLSYPVAHAMFIPEAAGMMAAVGQPLPMRPLVVLQLAARFIGLAVPSAAGRVAMNSAFLVKFGLHPAVAVVQGAIDGLSGFVVEATILAVALLVSERSFDLGGDVDWQRILLIAVVVVFVGVALVFFVRKLRDLVLPVLRDAFGSVLAVLKDPQRAMRLLTNNFLARLLLGVTLWIILRAIGVDDITIAVALTVTVATNLLAGLVPIPGGIGVAEAVMTSWLVLVGVPEAEAFAATVVYRMVTFYLPAVEGFFALRWLERRDYL